MRTVPIVKYYIGRLHWRQLLAGAAPTLKFKLQAFLDYNTVYMSLALRF